MTRRLALYCKSFRGDFDRLPHLLATACVHAPGFPFVLSIPRADHALLREQIGSLPRQTTLIFDEDYVPADALELDGWAQQQVCKLSLHRIGVADSYLVIDSDSYLIAPIDRSDFLAGTKLRIVYSSLFTGYSKHNGALLDFIDEDGAAHAATLASNRHCQVGRGTIKGFDERLAEYLDWLAHQTDASPMDRITWIHRLFEIPPHTALQPGQIMHATLLVEMEAFLNGYEISLARLIKLSPWEYNWYGSWASSTQGDTVQPSISPILHFADRDAVRHAQQRRLTVAMLARRFKIIQMAARHYDEPSY